MLARQAVSQPRHFFSPGKTQCVEGLGKAVRKIAWDGVRKTGAYKSERKKGTGERGKEKKKDKEGEEINLSNTGVSFQTGKN